MARLPLLGLSYRDGSWENRVVFDSAKLVRERGLEPPRSKAQEPKSCVSANSTTPAATFTVYVVGRGAPEHPAPQCDALPVLEIWPVDNSVRGFACSIMQS